MHHVDKIWMGKRTFIFQLIFILLLLPSFAVGRSYCMEQNLALIDFPEGMKNRVKLLGVLHRYFHEAIPKELEGKLLTELLDPKVDLEKLADTLIEVEEVLLQYEGVLSEGLAREILFKVKANLKDYENVRKNALQKRLLFFLVKEGDILFSKDSTQIQKNLAYSRLWAEVEGDKEVKVDKENKLKPFDNAVEVDDIRRKELGIRNQRGGDRSVYDRGRIYLFVPPINGDAAGILKKSKRKLAALFFHK